MSSTERGQNRIKARRVARRWSQAELADRAGISRAAVSAIEMNRLVPSVAAALALAAALECSVEELFSSSPSKSMTALPAWAWTPPRLLQSSGRYWCSRVNDKFLYYPVEATVLGAIPHDGIGEPSLSAEKIRIAESTLVVAGCDPAAGLLARCYERETGFRMLVFPRSSRQSLELLHRGVVHVAGVHLSAANQINGNSSTVREVMGSPTRMVRVATWEEGVAVGSGVPVRTVGGLLKNKVTWVGREPGSGARQCFDELASNRQSPRMLARDHRGVAEAIRCGWADAGVCLKLVADEAGLRFLSVRQEGYDLCFPTATESDPRIQSLIRVIRSHEYRELLKELPGYEVKQIGESFTAD